LRQYKNRGDIKIEEAWAIIMGDKSCHSSTSSDFSFPSLPGSPEM
jgi:hypothetical protein